jgi:hypothetical protein
MAAGIGPFIHKDNLVFGIDTGFGYADNGVTTRTYAGEPTTNLLPSPSINGRFSSSNSWGTYNTNRYNGAQYFSIGSISSVSDNIVTTTGNHTLLSFDVLRPQTSGGGVSAGTDYVIKRISSTQFSLHAYNGSQDGSQGYTNPSTQFFKVHDAYALDQRVAVNSSSFPTMWWGAPHLPNSGLIKETIVGGGKVPGTNCLRWHIYRGDGVADGMAYGVYTPVTQGDTITVSFWIRAASPTGAYKGGSYTTYFGGNGAYSAGFTCGAYGEWVHVVYQWTASVTYSFYQYWFPQGSGDIWSMDISDIQVEVNKGHATPFTASSRSTTQSLKDVTKQRTLNVSNVSFNSDNLITFDGTNDYIDINSSTILSGTQDFTIESVYNKTGNTACAIFGNYGPGYTSNHVWFSGAYGIYIAGSVYAPGHPLANGKYHMVATRQSGAVKLYLNGTLVNSGTLNTPISTNVNYRIGTDVNGTAEPFTGDLYALRVYSEALTAEDVQKNFRAYKERFDI